MVIDMDVTVELDLTEMLVLCDLLAVQTLPAVLRVEEPVVDVATADDARHQAVAGLCRRGLVDEAGSVDLHVRSMLVAAAAPEWLVEMRRVDVTQIYRMCLVGDGERRFVMSRNADRFTLRETTAADDTALVAGEILPLIGSAAGAVIPTVQFPSDLLDSALATCIDEMDHAKAFFDLGVPEMQSRSLAGALADCGGQTEIVALGAHADRRTVIAVFDTHVGRVVSLATPSNSGERWTSIAPGDHQRVSDALRQLAHTLPGGVR